MKQRRLLSAMAGTLAAALTWTAAAADLSAYGVAASSPVLRKSGLLLLPAEVAGGRALIPPLVGEGPVPAQLLASTGTLGLTGDPSQATAELSWDCGGAIPAAALTITGSPMPTAGTALVLVGQDENSVLSWHPAREIQPSWGANCSRDPLGLQQEAATAFQASGFDTRFFVARWSVAPTVATNKGCPVLGAFSAGFLGSDDVCLTALASYLDCDGKPADSGGVPPPVALRGVLELRDGSAHEHWLIFDVQGYEATGFAAVPWQPGLGVDRHGIQAVYYKGC